MTQVQESKENQAMGSLKLFLLPENVDLHAKILIYMTVHLNFLLWVVNFEYNQSFVKENRSTPVCLNLSLSELNL